MYYESRSYRLLTVANAAKAAVMVKTGRAQTFEGLVWKNAKGQRVVLVDDSHIDSSWLEVAILNLDLGLQVESITTGWMKKIGELREALLECQDYDASDPEMTWIRPATLNIEGSGDDRPAWFSCGCCGEDFRSTLRQQRPFDQDDGHGICQACAPGYADVAANA